MINESACRLLTLVGPGGIGKTRMALEAAAAVASDFAHGAHFVSLAALSVSDHIVSAIADALGFRFHVRREPKAQLLDYLREQHLLLVLDNFEHLLDGADLVSDILLAAPHVKLLVTSRERLNLQAEWSYELRGMDFPTPPQLALLRLVLEEAGQVEVSTGRLREEIEQYSAVQLFVQRARQAQATFVLSPADLPHVVRLYQLMDGMPLGLELAAPLVRSMSCEEIVQEVTHNLDFLATALRHVPDRHRSLRAIFEQTWQRLSAQEQAVFSQLSVFQGHCTRAAAIAVTQATLHDLSTLVDKALVRRDHAGHYTIHELIRHFAAEQLQAQPDIAEQTQARFIAYYAHFLHQRTADLKGRRHLQACLAICREIGDLRGSIYTYTGLANVALAHGAYAIAEEYLNQAYRLSQDFHDRIGQAQSLLSLSQLARTQGQTNLAIQRSQQALTLYESISYKMVAHALYQLGAALRLNGDMEGAQRIFQTSLEGSRARGYPVALAMCLSEMGCLDYDQGHYTQAVDQFREALALWERLGNEPEMASVHRHLGYVGLALGAERARSSPSAYQTALELALKHNLAPVALDVCVGVARLTEQAGDLDQAVELLALVEYHPASTHQTRMSAHQRLAELAPVLPGDRIATNRQRGQEGDWQVTARRLVESLLSPSH